MIVVAAPRDANEAALAWIEDSLMYAIERGQERLLGLLELVRVEILFEMDLGEATSLPKVTD
jgi:hypothetical protein